MGSLELPAWPGLVLGEALPLPKCRTQCKDPEDPTPPCCVPPPSSLCCSVSIATASLWDGSGIRAGAPPGPGPVPAPPNTVSGAGASAGRGQGLRHFQKQRERNCWKGVRERVPGSEGARGVCCRL